MTCAGVYLVCLIPQSIFCFTFIGNEGQKKASSYENDLNLVWQLSAQSLQVRCDVICNLTPI